MKVSISKLLIGSIMLLTLPVSAQMSEHEEVLARLHALEAESEIRHKLQTYMAALDTAMETGNWDNYVTFFTQDALLIMSEGNRQGRDDIRERMSAATQRMAGAAESRPVRKQVDLLSNIEVNVDGNTASSRSRYTFIAEDGNGGFAVTGSGLYIDTWAYEDDEWLIASREVDFDMLRSFAPPSQEE